MLIKKNHIINTYVCNGGFLLFSVYLLSSQFFLDNVIDRCSEEKVKRIDCCEVKRWNKIWCIDKYSGIHKIFIKRLPALKKGNKWQITVTTFFYSKNNQILLTCDFQIGKDIREDILSSLQYGHLNLIQLLVYNLKTPITNSIYIHTHISYEEINLLSYVG